MTLTCLKKGWVVKVMTTNARGHQGIDQLRKKLSIVIRSILTQLDLDYPPMIKQAIRQASTALEKRLFFCAPGCALVSDSIYK